MEIAKHTLESELTSAYEISLKSNESYINLKASADAMIFSSTGAFASYSNKITLQNKDTFTCKVKIKTLLDFVKNVSTPAIILTYNLEKNSLIVASSNKKSKMAIQCESSESQTNESLDTVNTTFSLNLDQYKLITNHLDLAASFCSLNSAEFPLTGVNVSCINKNLVFKSTNGILFFKSKMEMLNELNFNIFMHPKTGNVMKVIKESSGITIDITSRNMIIKNNNMTLKIMLLSSNDKFPYHINDLSYKTTEVNFRPDIVDFKRGINMLSSISSGSILVELSDRLYIATTDSSLAAKEEIELEHVSGSAKSNYDGKMVMDSLNCFKNNKIDFEFIEMNESVTLLKMFDTEKEVFICPST